MPRQAQMWNHFSVVDANEKKAECLYCKKIFSYKTTISNLKKHLHHKHLIQYESISREITRNTNETGTIISDRGAAVPTAPAAAVEVVANPGGGNRADENVGGGNVGEGSSGDGRVVITNPPKRQRMMSSYLAKPISSAEKTVLDKLLLNMIAVDCQPFSIVNDEGFRLFVHKLNPNYQLPNRKTLSTTLLSQEYEHRLNNIKAFVSAECSSMCIAADCWTSHTMQSYIAITGHFITKTTTEFKSVLLQCSLLEGSHTGENIAQAISSMAQDWRLLNKINFFVTDNASNMQSAANILNYPHYGCYAHKLNLVAQNGLGLQEVDSTITKVKKIVTYFKRSSIAKEKLLKYQVNSLGVAEGSALTLIMSVTTRWNSIYLMLQRFTHLQEVIRATVPNLNVDLPIIPLQEWRCLEQFCEVLKPLYEATLIMSAENYLTASKAVVITDSLKQVYEEMQSNTDYYDPVKNLAKKICIGLKSRFQDLNDNLDITVCTILDPRFKQHAFEDRSLRANKAYLIEKICENIGVEEPDHMNSTPSVSTGFSLWGNIEKKILASQEPRSTTARAEEEVDMFLKQTAISREKCPLEWWRGHKTIYPSLFAIFQKHCNIIVTSVPCERAFSKAGQIINDRRTRLTSNKVTKLMFLHGNKNF